MRITGGKAARRILKVPKGIGVRPTPDLVKQAVFNSLGARVVGARVLELFAGTGARRGDAFDHLVGVEYDRVTPGYPTPRPIEILAHSPLVCEDNPSHSDSAYYTVRSGAGVFASGTMRWVEGLMAGTGQDGADHAMDARTAAFVTRTTENLFTAFAAGPAGRLQPAPTDNVKEVYA